MQVALRWDDGGGKALDDALHDDGPIQLQVSPHSAQNEISRFLILVLNML